VLSRGGAILAIHPGALGDVILFGHLLYRLKSFLKGQDQEVTLVAGGEKARLLAGLGVACRAMDFDALPMHEVFLNPSQPAAQCQLPSLLGRHERLVSCFAAGNTQAQAALAEMCGARLATFLPVRPPADFPGHLVDLWAERMGLPALVRNPPPWPVPPEWQQAAAGVLAMAGVDPAGRYVVVHPGAGATAKCWPVERFIDLAGWLGTKSGLVVVSVLGPAERERWEARRIEALAKASVLLPSMDLPTLAGVLGGAGGFVGNDSGPAHLAAAVGAATVAVASPGSGRHFAPLGRNVAAVTGQTIAEVHPQTVGQTLVGLMGGQ
jgi:ADP-heptose:LPS heptosyltransferase